MEKLLSDKISPALVGFYQAAGVAIYTIFIASLFTFLNLEKTSPPEIVIAPFMMTLLVFSAGVTGSLVFALPVYFTFSKNNVKRAISILGFTFLYLLIAIFVAAATILTVY